MALVSDIEIRLRADIARLQQDMTAARRSVDGAMGGITNAVSLAKKALAGLGVGMALKELATQVIGSQREFDKLNSSLITATGSSQAAAGAFKALQAFAASTPYSVSEATEAFIKLRNLGLSPSEKALNAYGNTAAAMGKGLNQMIEAVADAATGEFERLKEFGIKSKQNGDQVLFTFQGVTKSIGNNAKDIEAYLTRIGEVEFAGAMERRANTLDGAISNLGDTWQSVTRAIASNGFGEGVMAGVIALSGALTDLSAIITAVGGAAHKEGEQVKEAAGLHAALTTVFEAVAVLGVNVAYVFTQVGKELAGLAAQANAVAHGDLAGAKAIGEAMRAEAEADRKAVDAKSEAILGAAAKAQVARDKEAADIKASGKDRTAGFAKETSAEEKRNQATLAIIDIRNKLNGVDKDTVGNLAKLKTALDTGAITQAEYAKYTAQIKKETTEASTAYKNQVKALDMSAAAIQRRAAAQAFANAQDAEHLAFLNRTGQLNDNDYAVQKGAADLKALEDGRTALEAQVAVERNRIDNAAKLKDLRGQIAAADQAIDAKKIRNDETIFELEQRQYREAVAHTADLIEASQQASATQRETTLGMQDEIEALGLTGRQLAEVTAARLRDRAAALDRRAEIGIIQEVNEELRNQAEELRKQADLGMTKERVQEQQAFWGDVEKTAHDTFVSIADGSKDGFTRMKDTAKNLFFDWLYQMTLKKWIINVGASFDGASATAGIANLVGGSGGGLASTASSLYSAVSGGMTLAGGVGTGFVGSVVGGLNGAGAGAAVTSSMGLQIGSSIASVVGPSVAGAISSGLGALAAAAPWVAGAVALFTVAKKAFGMGPKEYADSSTLAGSLGAGGFSGTMNTDYTKKGGWFRSDQHGTDRNAVDATLAASLSSTYTAIQDATAGFAQVLGLNAESIRTQTQTISIAIGKDEAANQKAIADFFIGVGDTLATSVLPTITQFQAAGESAATTLQRLATDFTAVNATMAKFGIDANTAFGAVGVASLEARERLLSLAGGLDALGTQMQYFNDNFLTDAEKVAATQKEIAPQMAALGMASTTTTAQYKDAVEKLVSSGALATAAGAQQYATLLALAPKFKQVADYLAQASAAADEAAKAAAEAAETALVDTLRGAVQTAFDALTRAVESRKRQAQTAFDSLMAGIEASITRTGDRVSNLQSLSQSLRNTNLPGTGMDRGAAQAQILATLAIARASGALPKAEDLQDALSALGGDVSDTFATFADFQRDQLRTANNIEELSGLTDDQLTVAERTLLVLQDQKAAAQSAFDNEMAGFDRIVTQAQLQLDAMNGIDTSVLSLADAFRSFVTAYGSAMSNKTVAAGAAPTADTQIEQLYNTLLGRTSDAAGLEYYASRLRTGFTTVENIANDIRNSTEYKAGHPPAVADMQGSGTMGDSSAVVAELRTLNTRIANVEIATMNSASSNEQLANQFNQVSAGGNTLLTTPA